MKKMFVIIMMVMVAIMSTVPMTTNAYNEEEAYDYYSALEEARDEGILKISSRNMKKLEKIFTIDEDEDVTMVTSVSNTAYGPYRMHAIVMVGYEVGDNFIYRSFTMDAVDDNANKVVINDVNTRWKVIDTESIESYDWSY